MIETLWDENLPNKYTEDVNLTRSHLIKNIKYTVNINQN